MSIQRILLSTTALVGLGVASINSAQAQLEVNLNGFLGVRGAFGDLQESEGGNEDSVDFSNDTEIHVNARGTADNGIRYGLTVEFEADTNRTGNTDETWIFFEGDFGGVRLGDEDGASDNMKVGGFSVAAGTGGIDGAVVGIPFGPSNSGDQTKVRYDGTFGPVQVGISYTPNDSGGDQLGQTNDDSYKNLVEGGVVLAPDFGEGFDLVASIVGGIADDTGGGQDFETIMAGAQFGIAGFSFAGGIGTEDWDGDERDYFNLGVGATFGGVNTSVTYGYNDIDPNQGNDSEVQDLVVSADIGLLPGVVLAGDLHFFDFDDNGGRDDGVAGVVRLRTAF